MLQLVQKRMSKSVLQPMTAALASSPFASSSGNKLTSHQIHLSSQVSIKKKAVVDEKVKLSKPKSQVRGIEILRNPSLFKVKNLFIKLPSVNNPS